MRVTVHIPDSLGPALEQTARNEGISISALTAKAVESYLKRKRKREAGLRLLDLISPDAVSPDAWEELEQGRVTEIYTTDSHLEAYHSAKVSVKNLRRP